MTRREAEAQTSPVATTRQHKACVPAPGTFTPRTKPRVVTFVLRALCELSRQGQSPSPRHPHPVTWAPMPTPFSHHCRCPGLLLVYLTCVKPVHLSEPGCSSPPTQCSGPGPGVLEPLTLQRRSNLVRAASLATGTPVSRTPGCSVVLLWDREPVVTTGGDTDSGSEC